MGDKKQTAVNYIEIKVKQMIENGGDADLLAVLQHINKAKAMEEEQIILAHNDFSENKLGELLTGKQYYNKTYKQE
jgi:hypothetical protein